MNEYTTPRLQGAGKSRLYDEDLYTDFPVDGHELNEDLTSTPALAEALRTSQLSRRVPSTSRQQASSAQRSGEVRHRPLGVFESEGHSGRQLTATQRAGYSSVGGHVRIHSFSQSVNHLFTHLFIYLFIYSFIHSFTYSFIHMRFERKSFLNAVFFDLASDYRKKYSAAK